MKKTWATPNLKVLDIKETMGGKGVICTYPPWECRPIGGNPGDGDEGSGDIGDS